MLDLLISNSGRIPLLHNRKPEWSGILVSSNVNDKNIHRACAYDVADYIQKPFQENVVWQRVQRIIDLYQLKKGNEEYGQAEILFVRIIGYIGRKTVFEPLSTHRS